MSKENLEKNFISAVLYINTADSAEGLKLFIDNVLRDLKNKFARYEIIAVDDDSKKEYVDVVKQFKDCGVTLLHMSNYQGMEMAMNAGRDLAIGDFVFEFDECSYNFSENQIGLAYEECLKDFDIVSCSDKNKSSVGSDTFYKIFNKFSDTEYDLFSDNFRIISRRGINRIMSQNKAVPYRKAIYANCGLKMSHLEYEPVYKADYSHDKNEKKARKGLAIDSLLLFTDIGYKCAATLSIVMAVIMILSAIYAIVMYMQSIAIEGWTTTMLFMSFAFFVLFIILTVVIKYLSLLLNLNFKKQRYLFKGVEKL